MKLEKADVFIVDKINNHTVYYDGRCHYVIVNGMTMVLDYDQIIKQNHENRKAG